jgi:hypothetical protein
MEEEGLGIAKDTDCRVKLLQKLLKPPFFTSFSKRKV